MVIENECIAAKDQNEVVFSKSVIIVIENERIAAGRTWSRRALQFGSRQRSISKLL
jgi:hypothetical protein